MKNTFFKLLLVLFLAGCLDGQSSHKAKVTKFYGAFDSGIFHNMKSIVGDSITYISGDYETIYDNVEFYEFFKWDSVFKPTYHIISLEVANGDIQATVAQNNIRNAFLKNNPLVFKVNLSFDEGKISKLEELEYKEVNWQVWSQRRDSLVQWIKSNHPSLDGFVNDMTMRGAQNYVSAIELYTSHANH